MEKQNDQKNNNNKISKGKGNIIIIIILILSVIAIIGFSYYKYVQIQNYNERINKQELDKKVAEEKVRQTMLKIHNIDKTPLPKDKLKEKALEYLKDLNVKSNIISEKETTEKDITSKDEEEITLYQYTLENGAIIKLLPYGLIHSYKDENKIKNIDNEWKKVKPTESFMRELETKINDNFKKMSLLKNFAIRDIIDYKDIVNPNGEIISIGIIYYDYVDTDINITEEKAKEIVQKDIEKDGKEENLAIKNSKITIEYAKNYNKNTVRKSYKIEVIYNIDKTSARDYYIDVNNGNIVDIAYYK